MNKTLSPGLTVALLLSAPASIILSYLLSSRMEIFPALGLGMSPAYLACLAAFFTTRSKAA